MMSDSETNPKSKDMEGLLLDRAVKTENFDVIHKNPSPADKDRDEDPESFKEECKQFMEEEALDVDSTVNNYKRCRKKFHINKALLAFRIVQFLWFGAGSLPSVFLGIFLKQRGLSLIEFSSIFSVIFLFQIMICFITGIITDKIGSAKKVLLFLMLVTSSDLIAMSLTPNINSVICSQLNFTFSNRDNYTSCYINCLLNNTQTLQSERNFSENLSHNASLSEIFDSEVHDSNPIITTCNISNIPMKNKNITIDYPKNDCCNACLSSDKVNCVTVRNRYLVAVYAVLILAFYSFWNAAYRFMDFTSISLSIKYASDFGLERVFATSGELIMIIITGFVLTVDTSSESTISFDPVLWIAAGIIFCAILILLMTAVPILPPGKNLMAKALSLVKNIDILAFVLLVFVAGNGFAFNFTFHLVFLEFIEAPSIVVALHSVAIMLYGFPLLFTFKWWLKKFGANKLFVLCLLFYTVNNASYSYIFNPWWSLFIDICTAFTYHLFWATVIVHCRRVAPVGFAATLNALTGAMHFGMGRSSGVFFGAMMMNYMGPRKANRVMAAIFFAAAILYSLYTYKRRKSPIVCTTINGNETTDTTMSKHTSI